jgi:hypothetical protein
MLTPNTGMNTRIPQVALKAIPVTTPNASSMAFMILILTRTIRESSALTLTE